MSLDKATRQKIIRDIFISLFIYALAGRADVPYFSINGKKPWLNPQKKFNSIIHR